MRDPGRERRSRWKNICPEANGVFRRGEISLSLSLSPSLATCFSLPLPLALSPPPPPACKNIHLTKTQGREKLALRSLIDPTGMSNSEVWEAANRLPILPVASPLSRSIKAYSQLYSPFSGWMDRLNTSPCLSRRVWRLPLYDRGGK